MEPETIGAIAGGAFVFLNFSGYWLREAKKHRHWKKNGNTAAETKKIINEEVKPLMTEVKQKVNCMDGKMTQVRLDLVRVETAVDGQSKTCSDTVDRFTTAISKQQDAILNIAKEK